MSTLIETLEQQSEQLFGKRYGLMSLWQEMADNFYPERADFTTVRNLGTDFAGHLTTSYPVIARRDLGNAISAMLRPTAKEWFKISTRDPEREDTVAKQWLEWTGKLMLRAMQDRASQFHRATKEGDHDFATFGQCAISVEMNKEQNGFLYRCWHLRDVVWLENAEGKVDTIYRKWRPTAVQLSQLFPGKLHPDTVRKMEKDPYHEVDVRHCILPAEQYASLPGAVRMRTPYVSVYYDAEHKHMLECVGSWTKVYTIPRWQTVSGSQYAHSPATVAALPDGRLLQAVSLALLEAGEKAVTPPMIAVQEAIRGDISVYAGGITWVDREYDERLGAVLKAVEVDKSGLTFGLETQQDLRTQLADAFYLSKLNLPAAGGPDMTAYEVGQRVQEFIRNTLPLFEPMEGDYNGGLCEDTFELLIRNSPEVRKSIPRSLQGSEIQFMFESPLHEAVDKAKVGQFMEAQQILATALQLDPSTVHLVDGRKATRDVLSAVIPAKWLRPEEEVDAMAQADAAAQQEQQMLATMQGGADVAKTLSETGLLPQGGV